MPQAVLAVTPAATAVVSSSKDADESRFLQLPEDEAATDGVAQDDAQQSAVETGRGIICINDLLKQVRDNLRWRPAAKLKQGGRRLYLTSSIAPNSFDIGKLET